MCFANNGGAKAAAAQQQQQADQALAQSKQQADEARADANARTASINTGKQNIDQAFAGFDDNYFKGVSDAYKNYAQPQLDDQYSDAKKNITYALARNGTTNSSIAGDEFGRLAKQYATNETGLAGTADNYASSARQNVFANKNDVTNQLISSGDAEAANTAAISAAKAIAVPSTFSPLGNLFTNVSALAAQNKLASDANPTGNGSSVGAKLFGSGTPSYYVGA